MDTILNPSKKLPVLNDIALLLARVSLGIILIAHGWQKFNDWTLAGTAESFQQMGVPAPGVSSMLSASAELLGGAMLVLGLATPLAALANLILMLGAFALVHVQAGVFVDDGGFELVLAIAAGLLLLAFAGAGRFSIDAAFRGSRKTGGASQIATDANASQHERREDSRA